MDTRGRIILISGPSGVGKGTIIKELLKNDNLNLIYSISTTTRKPRKNEINGKDYYFINEKEFEKRIKREKFLEWARFTTNYYGTEKKYVEENLIKGKNVILEIETIGALIIMKKFPPKDVVSIFIKPPNLRELRIRLEKRKTEEEELIDRRIKRAKEEIEMAYEYKYKVINGNLENTIKKIEKIISKEINKKNNK
ncbi:MAG: guanylate kinase [Candidatus Hepatoplasma vulgare]|nr:MAG: guanylate kinase [Candidatus Hepatoplasma sp.]